MKNTKPKIPSTHKAGETTYKLTQETFFYPKPKPLPKAKRTVASSKVYVQPVKIMNPGALKGGRRKGR